MNAVFLLETAPEAANPSSLLLLISLPVLGGLALLFSGVWCFRMIRFQRKLKYSIILVELRVPKTPYLAAAGALFFALFGLILNLAAPTESTLAAFSRAGLGDAEISAVFSGATALICGALAAVLTLVFSKSAVVDRGVFFGTGFLDWYHLYDYHIDEEAHKVILSSNKNGPLTLEGTSVPFRFHPNETEKLKFILNKNKNKFVPRYEVR